jgi:DNA polymerase III epsilon subunit-like protein
MALLLKQILQETGLYSYSTKDLLEKFLAFDGKTMIFLDTESTGLDPNTFYTQLTQVALLVVDGSTWEIKETFSTKVNIRPEVDRAMNDPSSREAVEFGKENQRYLRKYKKPIVTPKDLLDKSQYFSDGDNRVDEKDALLEVQKIVEKYQNVVLIAHNIQFDIKMIQTRRRINGLSPMKRYESLDTLAVSRYFFIPALVSLKDSEEAKKFLEMLLAKTKFKSYTTALGKLADVFRIKADNWHDALADVTMLFKILQKMIEFLEKNKDLDIRKYQGSQAKRYRNMR